MPAFIIVDGGVRANVVVGGYHSIIHRLIIWPAVNINCIVPTTLKPEE
jgi:hypothetical protein